MENKEQPKLLSARLVELEKKVRLLDKKLNSILIKLGDGR